MGRNKIYTDRERRLARILRYRINSRAWQHRHPDKVKAYRAARWKDPKVRAWLLAQNRMWQKRHPNHKSKMSQRAVRELRPFYVRALLKWKGIFNPTQAQIDHHRRKVQAARRKRIALNSRQLFAMLFSCSSLNKK